MASQGLLALASENWGILPRDRVRAALSVDEWRTMEELVEATRLDAESIHLELERMDRDEQCIRSQILLDERRTARYRLANAEWIELNRRIRASNREARRKALFR